MQQSETHGAARRVGLIALVALGVLLPVGVVSRPAKQDANERYSDERRAPSDDLLLTRVEKRNADVPLIGRPGASAERLGSPDQPPCELFLSLPPELDLPAGGLKQWNLQLELRQGELRRRALFNPAGKAHLMLPRDGRWSCRWVLRHKGDSISVATVAPSVLLLNGVGPHRHALAPSGAGWEAALELSERRSSQHSIETGRDDR